MRVYLSPTLNVHATEGLRYAVSIDDGEPQIVNMHADEAHPTWQEWVRNNVNVMESRHTIESPGEHVLKFWMVDPGVVLQKLSIPAASSPATSARRRASGATLSRERSSEREWEIRKPARRSARLYGVFSG